MKIIEIERLSVFLEYSAIFFTNEGIIVDSYTSSPIMHFGTIVEKLALKINIVYLDEGMLIVVCQNDFQLNKTIFKSQWQQILALLK